MAQSLTCFHRFNLGGPEEDHQFHHCCWTGRVSERDEEDEEVCFNPGVTITYYCYCFELSSGDSC